MEMEEILPTQLSVQLRHKEEKYPLFASIFFLTSKQALSTDPILNNTEAYIRSFVEFLPEAILTFRIIFKDLS